MKKRLLATLMMALICLTVSFAQESDSKRINKIKRDSKYLYAQETKPTEEEARKSAEEALQIYIEEYVASQKKLKKAEKVVIKDLQSKLDCIEMKRGTMVRAFVYVKKSDIIPADNVIVAEGPGDPEKTVGPVSTVEPIPAADLGQSGLLQWQQELVKDLLAKTSLSEARAYLNRAKAEYKVKRLGPGASAKNPEKLYWVIQGGDGTLIVLGPGSERRTNYRTMQFDQLSAYGGMDAIWFEMAK